MAKKTRIRYYNLKLYDYNELSQLDTDELLKVYNRTAERLNKQITRLKNAGLYDDASAVLDTSRARVYRSDKAKNKALQNVEQLTEDILKLQRRATPELYPAAVRREVDNLKTDVIVMLKGSHIGGKRFDKGLMDELWKSITPEDIAVIKKAKERYGVATADKLFYEIQTRLKYYDGTSDMPQFESKDDIINYIKESSERLPSNELPLSDVAAQLAKQYTKRW